MNIKKYIGDRPFYKMVLMIAVPIMVQNGVSNFVNLLDNLMIGRLGTNPLSGVAITNQIMFVYYLLVFGASAGVGIFTAQYYGMGDDEGVRITFRFKLIINVVLTLLAGCFLFFASETLVGFFLKGEGSAADAAETLEIGTEYMKIMLIGLVPVAITNAYSGTLRDTGQTRVPMVASIIAIVVNLFGNLILIYGLFGLPALGARGAAIATVFSRFVELAVLAIYTGTHSEKNRFIIGAFTHFHVPIRLAGKFMLKSLPLMANEALWALAQTTMNQCYSFRSLSAVASLNISSTLWNLLGVAFLAMGESVGIVVGQILGSGDIDKAKDHARKMRAFTVACGTLFGLIMVGTAYFFPLMYNTTEEVRHLATAVLIFQGIMMPFFSYTHASYFTIRCGGNTLITFIFDSCFAWGLSVPIAFCLSRFTTVSVLHMIIIVQSLEIVKCVIGGLMVRSGVWARNIVKNVS